MDPAADRTEISSQYRRTGAQHIYACMKCGFSFYRGASDPGRPPEPRWPCPQCENPDAEFTFTAGGAGSCEDVGP